MTAARNLVLGLLVAGLMAIPALAQSPGNNNGNWNASHSQYNNSQSNSSNSQSNNSQYNSRYKNNYNSRFSNNSANNNSRFNSSNIQHQPKIVSSARFLQVAARSDVDEIEIAQLAARRATDANIRNMAQQVISQQQQNLRELHQVASEVRVSLPVHASPVAKARYDHLSSLNGKQFDAAIVRSMVVHHLHVLPLFREQAQSAANPAVRSYARASLAMAQQHLNHAESIAHNDNINFPGNQGQIAANRQSRG